MSRQSDGNVPPTNAAWCFIHSLLHLLQSFLLAYALEIPRADPVLSVERRWVANIIQNTAEIKKTLSPYVVSLICGGHRASLRITIFTFTLLIESTTIMNSPSSVPSMYIERDNRETQIHFYMGNTLGAGACI